MRDEIDRYSDFQASNFLVRDVGARQGMIIVVPKGDSSDETRQPEFYDGTYEYLKDIGIEVIGE